MIYDQYIMDEKRERKELECEANTPLFGKLFKIVKEDIRQPRGKGKRGQSIFEYKTFSKKTALEKAREIAKILGLDEIGVARAHAELANHPMFFERMDFTDMHSRFSKSLDYDALRDCSDMLLKSEAHSYKTHHQATVRDAPNCRFPFTLYLPDKNLISHLMELVMDGSVLNIETTLVLYIQLFSIQSYQMNVIHALLVLYGDIQSIVFKSLYNALVLNTADNSELYEYKLYVKRLFSLLERFGVSWNAIIKPERYLSLMHNLSMPDFKNYRYDNLSRLVLCGGYYDENSEVRFSTENWVDIGGKVMADMVNQGFEINEERFTSVLNMYSELEDFNVDEGEIFAISDIYKDTAERIKERARRMSLFLKEEWCDHKYKISSDIILDINRFAKHPSINFKGDVIRDPKTHRESTVNSKYLYICRLKSNIDDIITMDNTTDDIVITMGGNAND